MNVQVRVSMLGPLNSGFGTSPTRSVLTAHIGGEPNTQAQHRMQGMHHILNGRVSCIEEHTAGTCCTVLHGFRSKAPVELDRRTTGGPRADGSAIRDTDEFDPTGVLTDTLTGTSILAIPDVTPETLTAMLASATRCSVCGGGRPGDTERPPAMPPLFRSGVLLQGVGPAVLLH